MAGTESVDIIRAANLAVEICGPMRLLVKDCARRNERDLYLHATTPVSRTLTALSGRQNDDDALCVGFVATPNDIAVL
jgi:hypothetical protein